MDRKERLNDPEEALRAALDGHQAGIWTSLPSIVQSFDYQKMTCVVQPSIMGRYRTAQGVITNVVMPLLVDCPVLFPSGGGFTLTFPISEGDEALVFFASRCIDGWWQSGQIQPQVEFRMHDLSDGFALVGPRSQTRLVANISAEATQLRSDDGRTFIEVQAENINVVSPSGVNVNAGGDVTIGAASNVTISADKIKIEAFSALELKCRHGIVWEPNLIKTYQRGVPGLSFDPPAPDEPPGNP